MSVSIRFQIAGYPAAEWLAPTVLKIRELASETDTGKFKLGDGATGWSGLPYLSFWSKWGRIEGALTDQADLTAALAGKQATIAAGTTAQYWRGDKTFQTLDKAAVGLPNVEDKSSATIRGETTSLNVTAALGYIPTSVTGLTGSLTVVAFKVGLGLVKADVGLGSVDNTSDANKPISTAQATALAGKEPAITAGAVGQYWRGDKSWQTLDKAAVGLGNADNTSDANKSVSTAQAAALALKSPLASPTFTGVPAAPTAAAGTNTTQLATTAFVAALGGLKIDVTQKGAASGVATLDAGGKVPTSQLPPLAITSTFVVNTQAAQMALVAEEGDVAVRTDVSRSYIRNAGTAGTMADWNELLTPTDAVISVNGMTGAVTVSTITGNAGTASTLQTARSIAMTGDVTYTVSFNGGANVTAVGTIAANTVTFGKFVAATAASIVGATAAGNFAQLTPASARTVLGLVVGTDIQAYDGDLAAIAALTTTPFGRAFLVLLDAAAGRAALALGTMATQNANAVAITDGSAALGGTLRHSSGTQAARFEGTPTGAPVGASGLGSEIGVFAGFVFHQAYNRTTSAYIPFMLDGSTVSLRPGGSAALTAKSTAINIIAQAYATDAAAGAGGLVGGDVYKTSDGAGGFFAKIKA